MKRQIIGYRAATLHLNEAKYTLDDDTKRLNPVTQNPNNEQ